MNSCYNCGKKAKGEWRIISFDEANDYPIEEFFCAKCLKEIDRRQPHDVS